MFRAFVSLLSKRTIQSLPSQTIKNAVIPSLTGGLKLDLSANFGTLHQSNRNQIKSSSLLCTTNNLLQPQSVSHEQIRTVIKFSWKKGKRKTVKAVISRFYRLNCGNWIRTLAGRNKRKYKKSAKQKIKSRQHFFCNATQCTLLDKMVSKYWRKPKYYIKNPYEPYEWRENFYFTRRKPWRPEGCDYE